MGTPHVVIVGAGVGGLVAAVDLAARGVAVTLLERAPTPGGKLREVHIGDATVDAGPTVFTMRWVFDEIFADAGASLDDHLHMEPAEILARHAWSGSERLDLFADAAHSEAAIGDFAGAAAARGFRDFRARAQNIWRTLEHPFIRGHRPTPFSLVRGAGLRGIGDVWRISPFATLWSALGEHFADPRLRQLFGRYATYAGSSPFLAPATLMLIAHVEQGGVWLVEGGMQRIAEALAGLAVARGARIRYAVRVDRVETTSGRASGVVLADGERIAADAVVFNGDVSAFAGGLLGRAAAGAAPAVAPAARSLSAVTWAMQARARGFPLLRHSVFFSADYAGEFAELLRAGRLPGAPTVYVCAQDRGGVDAAPPDGAERLLILVNAPANGDTTLFTDAEIAACETATFSLLTRCGLTLERTPQATVRTLPSDFEALCPATGGALYGQSVHGPMASFRRPGARSKLPGLYLAGGSTHPGAGVPMAALSGRLAASSVLADLASTVRSRTAATRGGISTR